MKIGEKKQLVLPPELAYGQAGVTAPNGVVIIPENATVIFDIELLNIQNSILHKRFIVGVDSIVDTYIDK
jgi:hypothetical protein